MLLATVAYVHHVSAVCYVVTNDSAIGAILMSRTFVVRYKVIATHRSDHIPPFQYFFCKRAFANWNPAAAARSLIVSRLSLEAFRSDFRMSEDRLPRRLIG